MKTTLLIIIITATMALGQEFTYYEHANETTPGPNEILPLYWPSSPPLEEKEETITELVKEFNPLMRSLELILEDREADIIDSKWEEYHINQGNIIKFFRERRPKTRAHYFIFRTNGMVEIIDKDFWDVTVKTYTDTIQYDKPNKNIACDKEFETCTRRFIQAFTWQEDILTNKEPIAGNLPFSWYDDGMTATDLATIKTVLERRGN